MQVSKSFKIALLSVIVYQILLSLAGCGRNSSPPAVVVRPPVVNEPIFRYPLKTPDVQTFDPALAADADSIRVVDTMFTGLVQLDDQLRVRPQLAASWEQSPDGLTWTFHLKPGLTFSDGSPLTSHDVAYSIDRALQADLKSPTSPTFLRDIQDADQLLAGKISTIINDSIQTPDNRTVVILTKKAAAYFLYTLSYPCSYVVEKKLVERYGNSLFTNHLNEGGGAGPFLLVQHIQKQEIDLKVNSHYYGPKPRLNKIIFTFYQDEYSSYDAYQSNHLDFTELNSGLFTTNRLRTDFHRYPLLEMVYFGMNYATKPFDNIHIRQALELAIDKDYIVHTVTRDKVLATNHLIPLGMQDYNPNLTGPAGIESTHGDLTEAKLLFQQGLREEGWWSVAQMPPIKISYPNDASDARDSVADIIQMWHNAFGITATINPLSDRDLARGVANATNNPDGLQMWRASWKAVYPDPQDVLELSFGKDESNNNVNYGHNRSTDVFRQQNIQQMLAEDDVEQDQQARVRSYQYIEQQLVNEVAWLPMWQRTGNYLLKPCVQGIVLNALELIPPDDWARIDITTQRACDGSGE
ncbi:MAG: peptide ABC transporter substrate-binding protein [Chloroflexi bacterium]|nr:peptide ABC transporter substrate-binding protein [Chloroflexota bacterium]